MVERTYTFAIFATILFIIAIIIFMVGFFDIGGKKKDDQEQEEAVEPEPAPDEESVNEEKTAYIDIYGETVTLDNVDSRIEEDTNRSIIILSAVFAILALVCLIVQLRT